MKQSLKKTSSEYEEQSEKFFCVLRWYSEGTNDHSQQKVSTWAYSIKKKSGRLRMFSDFKRHFMGFFAHNFLFKLSYIILCKSD